MKRQADRIRRAPMPGNRPGYWSLNPWCLAVCSAAALLWPLAAMADGRIVAFESPRFTVDTRPPTAVVVDPASRMVAAESGRFILDTRPPVAPVDPASRMVAAASGLFPLDTRPHIGPWQNMFGLRIIGASNETVVVEACTNLLTPLWYPLGTNALVARTFYFLDPWWTNYPQRFYRVVQE